ncbi:MAG: enoyl-CoA hydratase/isomerase family protein [Candidatus Omnitrophica bacterium]|nr:enoyl-CoA hydratase/isomerase family protein [Candidatus Omnitrophota bacterium]
MSVIFREQDGIGYIEFDQPDSKVNVLNVETIGRLDKMLSELSEKSTLKAIVFLSKKKNVFIAGADIKEIEKITEIDDGIKKAKAGQDLFNKIEDLPMPTIAVIDGVALGGGCELALACLFRVATFNDKVSIGLPEVNLGFVPGFGGTYRLPRVVGLSEGLKLILTAKPITGDKALKIGLVDRLFPNNGLDAQLQTFIDGVVSKKIKKERYQPPAKKGIPGLIEKFQPLHRIIFNESRKSVLSATKGFYPAPLKAIHVVSQNFYCGRSQGLHIEREAFGELAVTEISKNLVHVFYIMEKYKKLSVEGLEDIKPQEIQHCSVIGAGIMGGGIAQALSTRDIWVRMKDISYDALAQGLKAAARVYYKAVETRKLSKAQAQLKMAHITTTLDYSGLKNSNYIIEAVVENMDVKKKVFHELSYTVNDQAILATNTSALSVTEMAKETKDPSKVIGLHFFNPVHRMSLVEIIVTDRTSKETLATTLNLAKKLGKTPIIVKDTRGFIVNRILLVYMSEAGRILEETGDMVLIDKIMTDFGMPMGPFILSDEVGLDVGLKVMRILEESFGERFKPADTFAKLYEKKALGKKTKRGFYTHNKQTFPNADVQKILGEKNFQHIANGDIERRLIYLMINEAALCLQEGVVPEADAIDVGMIFGTGFPPFRGGLLRYADKIGISVIVDEMNMFKDQYKADRFTPCRYLLELKQKGSSFYKRGA